jgi:hypothetical protein
MNLANLKRIGFGIASLLIIGMLGLLSAGKGEAQAEGAPQTESRIGDAWEYLIVAGGNVNLDASGSGGRMRKEPGPFARENYPLQGNLDKLGAKGWELIQISGSPGDPVFYFKRRK